MGTLCSGPIYRLALARHFHDHHNRAIRGGRGREVPPSRRSRDSSEAQTHAVWASVCGFSSSGINKDVVVIMSRTAEEGKRRPASAHPAGANPPGLVWR